MPPPEQRQGMKPSSTLLLETLLETFLTLLETEQ